MRKLFLLPVLFLIVSVGFAAEKQLLVLGGGGEPAGATTLFDFEIGLFKGGVATAAGTDWKTVYSFNGGHQKTESIVKSVFNKGDSRGEFTEKNFNAILYEYENKLNSGDLKSGDQLLMVINTHGARNQSGENSHSIALTRSEAKDKTDLRGTDTVSLDKLEKIAKLASEKGIKLAIVDFSCFSGNTVAISNPDVCVISSTGTNQTSKTLDRINSTPTKKLFSFSEIFTAGLKKGENLENLFLKTRTQMEFSDYAMISTEEGRAVDQVLRELITPYSDSAFPDINRSFRMSEADYRNSKCQSENQFKELDLKIKQVQEMAKIANKTIDVSKIKNNIIKYREIFTKYEQTLGELFDLGQEAKNLLAKDYPEISKDFAKEDGLSLIRSERGYSNSFCEEVLNGKPNKYMKDFCEKSIAENKNKEQVIKEIKNKLRPRYEAGIKKLEDLYNNPKIRDQLEKLSESISKDSKALYSTLYRSQKPSSKNPCRDFVL